MWRVSRVYRYCIKPRYPASTAAWCNSVIEAVATATSNNKEQPEMITKNNATTGYGWKMASGIGLVGVTAVLIAVMMFANRAGAPATAMSLQLPASIRTFAADLANTLGFGETFSPMQSVQLGIDLPRGADVRTLPRGLADYIRSG